MRKAAITATIVVLAAGFPSAFIQPAVAATLAGSSDHTPVHAVRTSDGKLKPASGYRWAQPDNPDNLEVKLKEGLMLTPEGEYKPAPGYTWLHPSDKTDLEVRLKSGLIRSADGHLKPAAGYTWEHPDDPNDFSVKPAWGYRWVNPDDPNDYSVRLRTGLISTDSGFRLAPGYSWLHPEDPNDLSVKPAVGYVWVDPDDPKNLAVRRLPGTTSPSPSDRHNERIELGWMNVTPCSKVEMIENDFGFSSPGLVTADQRLIAYADADVSTTTNSLIEATIKECALAGAAACGLSSLISSPAACFPTFKTAFLTCANARIANLSLNDLRISVESQCMW